MGRRILIVVDYQNDFVDGALGFEGAELLDEGIAKKIREYGEGNVFYTLDTHYKIESENEDMMKWNYLNTREGKALPIEHCIKGTRGWEVYGETAKALKEVNAVGIEKLSFGISPEIMYKIFDLQNDVGIDFSDVDEIELVGLVTNMCVLSNAVIFQAQFPNAQIIVDASLCASFDKDLHNKTLDVMRGLQIKVINDNK